MRSARVLVLYNEPVLPADHPDADSEHEILYTVDIVTKTLIQAGFEVTRLGASHNPEVLVDGLRAQRPDVVFNLFEGTADGGHNEAYVAGLLEWMNIPFTGSPFQALCMARNKHLTKRLLQGADIPTPEFFVVEELPIPECPLEWPVIVKPATEDASVGLDQGSVVTDQQSLQQRIAQLLNNYGPPILVEQYIQGRELNIALIESPKLKVLPISEILFVDKTPGYWPIVTYDAKWKPGTRDYEATPPRYPAEVSPKLAEKLEAIACDAFNLLGCRDYARVDFRVRPPGRPYVLEVNPNPDFSPTAGLTGGLTAAGITHSTFTVDLIHAALARGKKRITVQTKKTGATSVRRATAKDREAVQRISESLNKQSRECLDATLGRLTASLAEDSTGSYHFLVAERPAGVVGYVSFARSNGSADAFGLFDLAVAQAVQGQHVGRDLFHAVETEVQAAGGRLVVVESSSNPRQTGARQFLLHQGLRLVGDIPDFHREGESKLTYVKYLKTRSLGE
jgi:D-alanine-D-alanine ligase